MYQVYPFIYLISLTSLNYTLNKTLFSIGWIHFKTYRSIFPGRTIYHSSGYLNRNTKLSIFPSVFKLYGLVCKESVSWAREAMVLVLCTPITQAQWSPCTSTTQLTSTRHSYRVHCQLSFGIYIKYTFLVYKQTFLQNR